MIIFPAIDIRGGKCVRLLKGDFKQETVFSDRPEEMAKKWQAQGAQFLHLVDLDGALAGESRNLETVKKILAAVDIPGSSAAASARWRASTRSSRLACAASSSAPSPCAIPSSSRRPARSTAPHRRRHRRQGRIVAVDGWGVSGDVEATALAKEMKKAGVKTIIYTDISRDGTLSGVNVEATAKLARESGVAIVASGGVKSIADIEALKPYEKAGIEGVIVGKSIYMGTLDLAEAIEIAAKEG